MPAFFQNISKASKNALLLCLITFSCFIMQAQSGLKYSLKFKLLIKEGDLKNSSITITKNGAPIRVIVPSGGTYTIDLDFNEEYIIVSSKTGYITKGLIIDTHVPAGRESEDFARNYPTVELEKQPENQEIIYTQPVAKINFNTKMDDFDFNKDYSHTAEAMVAKAKANPISKPKPATLTPTQKPDIQSLSKDGIPPTNPIAVVVKPSENKPESPKIKPVQIEPEENYKPVVRNKEESVIQEDRKKTTIVTVKMNEIVIVYKKEEFSWGGVYFYRDGKNITADTFEKETK